MEIEGEVSDSRWLEFLFGLFQLHSLQCGIPTFDGNCAKKEMKRELKEQKGGNEICSSEFQGQC